MSSWRFVRELLAFSICLGWLFGVLAWFDSMRPETPNAPTFPDSRFNDDDIRALAVVATFEGQVFPEPLKSQAYRAISWTIRNRAEIGFGGTVRYSDERLLGAYSSYKDHKYDSPDPRATEIVREVLNALTHDDDPTRGARNFVDHSYWTGTAEQIGATFKVRGKFSDSDVQRMVEDGKFALVIEWKAPLDHPRGPLFYGLYFFDYWPPPTPVVTPLPTATRRSTATNTPTSTLTPTATRTSTVILTPTLTTTPSITTTVLPTATIRPR